MTHIVVLGAGYAGQIAANLAARTLNAEVTLVNERDRFVERVRLHQLAAGQELRELPLTGLLRGSGVRLVVDRVTAITTADRAVDPGDGGAGPLRQADLRAGQPCRPRVGARRGRARVHGRQRRGGGAAARAGAARRDGHGRRRRADRYRVGDRARRVEPGPEGAAADRGQARRSAVRDAPAGTCTGRSRGWASRSASRPSSTRSARTVSCWPTASTWPRTSWCGRPGSPCRALARDAGLAVDEHGRVVVDESMRSVSHPDVYGVGDAAAMHLAGGQELRMSCATGAPIAQAGRPLDRRPAERPRAQAVPVPLPQPVHQPGPPRRR